MTTETTLRRPLTTAGTTILGLEGITARAAELDLLANLRGHGLRGSSAWIVGLADPHHSQLLVALNGEDVVEAALPLVVQPSTRTVRTPGHDLGHCAVVLSRDDAATAALADGLCKWAGEAGRQNHILLGPLLADAASLALCQGLDGWLIPVSGEPVPALRRDHRDEALAYLASGMRRTLRKAANRLAVDGRSAEVSTVQTESEMIDILPALAQIHRKRDHDRGLRSQLDSEVAFASWARWLTSLAHSRRLEITLLLIDGRIASYVVATVDGAHYRVIEGVFDPEFARYAPGRLLEAAVLQQVLDRGTLDSVDWMTSIAPESLLTYNFMVETLVLSRRISTS